MVQTRIRATTSAQSDPPAPPQHRYATRSASRAESSDLHAVENGAHDDVTSAPPSSSGRKKKEVEKKQPLARADDDEDEQQQQKQQRASRGGRKAAPALPPVEEEEDASDDHGDADDDNGASSSEDEEEEEDAEELAMLQGLAASIEAAFKQKKQQPAVAVGGGAGAGGGAPRLAAPPADSSSESESESDGDSDNDDDNKKDNTKVGLWQPSTGLAPAPSAARVALGQLGVTPHHHPAGVTAASARAAPLDPKAAAKAAKEAKSSRPDTAGPRWYDLPATAITDDVKRELRLLRLRGAYDPKRFYRSYDGGRFPRYFAVATVEDDPLEPASSRLSRHERRRATITEQLLADGHLAGARKRRFDKLQEDAARLAGMGKSGQRGVLAANKRQRASKNPRLQKSHHRPKH